jgi:hypothetical protein
MSTRSHILFRDDDDSLLTYKHHDGYPDAVIPLLREFWQWYPRTTRLEYLTATWFYYCKRRTEERLGDRYDAPMKTGELAHNHPIALSYGICADNEIHGDVEHLYEVDIEEGTVAHHTPERRWFENVESPSDIVGQEPDETYSLTLDERSVSASSTSSPASGITDGGGTPNLGLSHGCAGCGSTEEINWVVQAGTPAGEYLNLVGNETAELCDNCMQEVVSRADGENV